jgi:hypothetical protein
MQFSSPIDSFRHQQGMSLVKEQHLMSICQPEITDNNRRLSADGS